MIEKVIIIECDECLIQEVFGTTDRSVAILTALREGWTITEDQHLCPRCKHDNDKTDNISV